MLDDLQRSVPEAVQDGIATEADQRRPGKLALGEGEHQPAMLLAERADRVVEDHPARRVQQQTGEGQALLLVQRQLPVPALGPVERGHEVAKVHPLERADHGRVLEATRLGGIAHGRAQRAERQIRPRAA